MCNLSKKIAFEGCEYLKEFVFEKIHTGLDS
jgi:hypothetical protein